MAIVKYYGRLRHVAGKEVEEITGKNIREVVRKIRDIHGREVEELCKRSVIMIDGRNASLLKGFSTRVDENSEMKVIPVSGGG